MTTKTQGTAGIEAARAKAAEIRSKATAEAEKEALEKEGATVVNTPKEAKEAVEEKMKKVNVNVSTKPEVVEETTALAKQAEPIAPAEIDQKTGQLMLTSKHLDLIKTQIAPTATPEEFDLFIMMARRTRLDPLLKQLYFFKYKDRRESERQGKDVYSPATYVTSIDGYRIIAHRTGYFDGVDEPEYKYINNKLYSCTIKVYKKGSSHAFAATVKFDEYNTSKQMWAKMPETMIAKVAEAHALRKAFPQDLSGIYTTDEMDQAGHTEPAQIAAPKKVPMVTKGQVNDLKIFMDGKNISKERIKAFVKKAFNKNSIADLTFKEMAALLKKLDELPTPEPDPIDEATAIFSSDPEPSVDDIDLDEIDEGIAQMQSERGDL